MVIDITPLTTETGQPNHGTKCETMKDLLPAIRHIVRHPQSSPAAIKKVLREVFHCDHQEAEELVQKYGPSRCVQIWIPVGEVRKTITLINVVVDGKPYVIDIPVGAIKSCIDEMPAEARYIQLHTMIEVTIAQSE